MTRNSESHAVCETPKTLQPFTLAVLSEFLYLYRSYPVNSVYVPDLKLRVISVHAANKMKESGR